MIRLHDVALCEKMACNLVSLRLLRKKGYYWDTKSDPTTLKRKDDSIAGVLDETMDQFVLEHLPEAMPKAAMFAQRNRYNSWTKRKPMVGDSMRWHLRMGHPGPQTLQHLVNSSEGVRIRGLTTVECQACGVSKAKRAIRRQAREVEQEPGARLAIDFHDYEPDDKAFCRQMLVTDRFSGMIWDYYLKDHSAESINIALHSILGILERQYGMRAKVIECDNEITMVRPSVGAYLQSLQIRLEPSPVYTQSQNGAAERSGGVVKEKARAMCSGANLPEMLWKEIVRAAVYLLNRTPRYQYRWKTPYDRFHTAYAMKRKMVERTDVYKRGKSDAEHSSKKLCALENAIGVAGEKKPNQSHLRVYGCKAYAMTTDALRKSKRLQRLKPKAWVGYLIGYDSTNVYRIWNPMTNQVIRTRDVAFNEEEIYPGNIDELRNDMRRINLADLSTLLQKCAIPEKAEEEAVGPSVFIDEPISGDNLVGEPGKDSLSETGEHSDSSADEVMMDDEKLNEAWPPYPTPSPSPPPAAFMLALAIRGTDAVPASTGVLRIPKTDCWKASFMAGTRSGSVAKVGGLPFTKAQYERIHSKPLGIHRRDLPPPPQSRRELRNHPMAELFKQAERDHLKSHSDMGSWKEVERREPQRKRHRVLDCKWVYVYKFDKHGRFLKVKARLVVRGDQQTKTLDMDTYAATLAGRSFRTIMALAARFDLELLQYDAVNAFVNAKLDEDIYMKMPPGYRKDEVVLKLQKALYGLRRSPLLWQKELQGTITKLGFTPIPHEPCCYKKNGILIFFYVDDIVFACRKNQVDEVRELAEALRKRYKLTGGDSLQWFLGMEVIRDRQRRLIWLSQASYIDKIANLAETERCTPLTPMTKEELLPSIKSAAPPRLHAYQRKIGSLLYAAVITRPDIAFAVSRLSRFLANPDEKHHAAADRVLHYLRSSRSLALQFGQDDHFRVASDASFADNSLDRKSSQAYAMKLFGGMIGWRANKQDTVTTSTTEAELLALSQAAKEALFVNRLLSEMDIDLDDGRILIECDNKQTIRLVTEEITTLKTKLRHVDIHNHWLRQEVENQRITVQYTESAKMIADGLTKALQNNDFKRFLGHINLRNIEHLLDQNSLRELDVDEAVDPT